MKAYDLLLLPENLNYAWQKARRLYRTADGYIDNGELAEFELDLERRLMGIQRQFQRGSYRLKKLRPLPRPKKINNDLPVDRQYYHVAVDDQVAWIAIVNVLGPALDKRMPSWSYGNRIYRPAWYERGEDRLSTLEIGPYRHSSGHLYRKFQHSWPLFRRHVALTAQTMVKTLSLDDGELDQSDRLAVASAEKEGLPYLRAGFWKRGKDAAKTSDLYHASIDLKQFYPRLTTKAVMTGLAVAGAADEDRMRDLLTDMLGFRLDRSDMPRATLERVEPAFNGLQIRGIPTGLFVAGFLANAAMLPVDTVVDERIRERRSLAHFRFVDDHTILAYDFDELCAWIDEYRTLLRQHDTGVDVNPKKYDPASLSKWMKERTKASTATKTPRKPATPRWKAKEDAAIRDTVLDGANPTKLLTKTLGQVSAIAATNIEILDDEDLQERLKQLEWLLLADIPEREIRPDTRAAFAAGQIAALAPILVHEADGLVDAARSLAALKAQITKPEYATKEETENFKALLEEQSNLVAKLWADHERVEERHLRHCFGLLLQAFREYPGKARLFFRMHEYCRVTGFKGLGEIANWIEETRARGHSVWADYYAGLSLQILARSVLLATRAWGAKDVLLSEKEAALRHLEDVSQIDTRAFLVLQDKEAWFHAIARKEFGVSLLSVAEVLRRVVADDRLGQRLEGLARQCLGMSIGGHAETWEPETGRAPGVWAHLVESVLSIDNKPSPVWRRFEQLFSYSNLADVHAARRYPEFLPDAGWNQLLHSDEPLPETDLGWLREAMEGNDNRIEAARSSRRLAFTRAARSLEAPPKGWVTLAEWTRQISRECSPFDPRRSEWTALEIVRQIVSSVEVLGDDQFMLDRLHPNNVLVPESWRTAFACQPQRAGVSWEEWRNFAQQPQNGSIKPRDSAASVLDYRYFTDTHAGRPLAHWERCLVGAGRLLLGLLRLNHDALRIWNIRGNEQIFMLPRARWFQALAISSPTLLLMESCLDGRSAETRAIALNPGLFGWKDGLKVNDVEFDPPLLLGPTELLKALVHAQSVLKANQLAVVMNQPRQLIPFRLSDFATGPVGETEEEGLGE